MPNRLDLSLIEKDLVREAREPAGPMRWLRESYEAPDAFWPALLSSNGTFFAWPCKSRFGGNYDFFHDIFARNRQNPSPAFRWHEEGGGWRELGYAQLGRLAAGKAALWASLGAVAGGKLCIVSQINEQFLISLLAALKIGLVVSILPPRGGAFLRRRIDAVVPDFIWASEEHAPLLAEYRNILLSESATGKIEDNDARSHSYRGSEAFALCFDPSSAEPHVPRELSAESAYLGAVRDGMIALGLKPGLGVAAPGFCIMETQPAMLLACLLNGATYVHLTEHDLSRTPGLLTEQPLKAVGVTEFTREKLLRARVEIGKNWDFWFRDPAESQNIVAWNEFAEVMKLHDVFSGNQRWNASLGGCILFSVRRKGSPHLNILPAAGVPWHLTDPADEGRYSLWSHGWFSVQARGAEKDGITAGGMLTEDRNEWIFVRPVFAGRAGKCYPAREVLEALSGIAHGSSCSLVEVPASRSDGSSIFVLLVFAGGGRVSEASICEGIRMRIFRELGKEFLPDAIRVITLHPRRREDGSIDHEWCGKEYLSGGLTRRERGEVYQRITELRDLIHLSR
ncbi:MAG: hypothetical protein ABFD97_13000 [Syntrophobacter sp.]